MHPSKALPLTLAAIVAIGTIAEEKPHPDIPESRPLVYEVDGSGKLAIVSVASNGMRNADRINTPSD